MQISMDILNATVKLLNLKQDQTSQSMNILVLSLYYIEIG